MTSPYITCTGIDEATDLEAVKSLAMPGIEFGVLLSANPEGRARYPGVPFIRQVVMLLGRRSAVHVCGLETRARMLAGEYDAMLSAVGRIQVNGCVGSGELRAIAARFPRQRIITQHNGVNSALADVPEVRHLLLVDASGGRGILPAEWKAPRAGKPVGFAGGLGPDNLAEELPRIMSVACMGWWVDMESSLRAGDLFDINRARHCIDVATAFVSGTQP